MVPAIFRLAAKWLMAFAGPVPLVGLHSTVDVDELAIGDTGHNSGAVRFKSRLPSGGQLRDLKDRFDLDGDTKWQTADAYRGASVLLSEHLDE